jgi:hypothetical protein
MTTHPTPSTLGAMWSEAVDKRAREIWAEREKGFPPFVRQTWEQGTFAARCSTLKTASDELREV